MFRMLNQRRAQNTAEYAILIGVIVAAAIAMQVYVRRGMQARVKDAVDFSRTMDDQEGDNVFNATQYEPYYMDRNLQTGQDSISKEAMREGGYVDREAVNETMTRTGYETAGNYSGH